MSRLNIRKDELKGLIESVTSKIVVAKQVTYDEAEIAVNQLIELTGSAALALELDDKSIVVKSHNWEFTLTARFIEDNQ